MPVNRQDLLVGRSLLLHESRRQRRESTARSRSTGLRFLCSGTCIFMRNRIPISYREVKELLIEKEGDVRKAKRTSRRCGSFFVCGRRSRKRAERAAETRRPRPTRPERRRDSTALSGLLHFRIN